MVFYFYTVRFNTASTTEVETFFFFLNVWSQCISFLMHSHPQPKNKEKEKKQ